MAQELAIHHSHKPREDLRQDYDAHTGYIQFEKQNNDFALQSIDTMIEQLNNCKNYINTWNENLDQKLQLFHRARVGTLEGLTRDAVKKRKFDNELAVNEDAVLNQEYKEPRWGGRKTKKNRLKV